MPQRPGFNLHTLRQQVYQRLRDGILQGELPKGTRLVASQLAEQWGISRTPKTLAKLATIGGGPTFRRMGRVPLYDPDDLDAWVNALLSPPVRSTSELAQRGDVIAADRQ